MGPFRAFTIKDKFNSNGKESYSFKNLTGTRTSYSWDMFLAYCTTTFQLCIMQLLLALMSCKANILILFLETACPGMRSFGLVRGVRWSRGTRVLGRFMGYLDPNPDVGLVFSCEFQK